MSRTAGRREVHFPESGWATRRARGAGVSPAGVDAVVPATVAQVLNVGDRAYLPPFSVRVMGAPEVFEGRQLFLGAEDPGGIAGSVTFGTALYWGDPVR